MRSIISRQNGTIIPMHLMNRNGVPDRSGPFRALIMSEYVASVSITIHSKLKKITNVGYRHMRGTSDK